MEPEPTASIADELSKKRGAATETQDIPESTQDSNIKKKLTTALGGDGASTAGVGKKQQNNFLLFNAMRTTATHASTTFASSRASVEQGLSDLAAAGGTEVALSSVGGRSSETPAPSVPVPPNATAASQDGALGKTGAAPKKKRKRECHFLTSTLNLIWI